MKVEQARLDEDYEEDEKQTDNEISRILSDLAEEDSVAATEQSADRPGQLSSAYILGRVLCA